LGLLEEVAAPVTIHIREAALSVVPVPALKESPNITTASTPSPRLLPAFIPLASRLLVSIVECRASASVPLDILEASVVSVFVTLPNPTSLFE